MRLLVKMRTYGFSKLTPGYVSSVTFPMPLPPLPYFLIQVEDPHTKFVQVIHNIMERKVLFHLRKPTSWFETIKFVHIHFREPILGILIHKGGVIITQERVGRENFTLKRGLFIRHFTLILFFLIIPYFNQGGLEMLQGGFSANNPTY